MNSVARAVTLGVALAFAGNAIATDYKQEYDRRVKNAQNIGVLGDNLAGDTVNFNTGALTFRETDISLPTNGLLLSLARRYDADLDAGDASVHGTGWYPPNVEVISPRVRAFGDWDLDIPNIHTVMGQTSGWVLSSSTPLKRCSVVGQVDSFGGVSTARPPVLNGTQGWPFSADKYWNGYTLHVGNTDTPLLVASLPNAERPSTGGPYHWTTTNDWWISCLPTAANDTGEAYLARSPDGTTYTFNWLSKRIVNSATDYDAEKKGMITPSYLFRSEYTMLPTRIEDRFGNWITYTWSADASARLIRMDAGHAGSTTPVQTIAVAASTAEGYITQLKVQVSGEADRLWNYTYTDSKLTRVTLPDGKTWEYNLGLQGRADDYKPVCDLDPNVTDPNYRFWYCWGGGEVPDYELSGTVKHPSGATVTFVMGPNFRLDQNTAIINPVGLRRKTISGPGLTTSTWRFDYLPNKATAKDACHYSTCPSLMETDQVNPDGSVVRHIYSLDSRQQAELAGSLSANGGGSPAVTSSARFASLLTVPTPSTGTVPIWYSEQDTRYIAEGSAPFTVRVGVHPLSYATAPDPTYLSQRRLPVAKQIQTLQGTTFTTEHTGFDAYGRATATTEGSAGGSGGNSTRYLTRSYYDDANKWVIGQLRSTGCTTTTDCGTSREISRTDFDPATALPWKTYRYGQLENEFTYTNGLLTSVKDARGYSIGLGSWNYGIPQSITFPTTATMAALAHPFGWIKSVTDETGAISNFGYDPLGSLTSIAYPTGDSVAWANLSRNVSIPAVVEYGLPIGHWRREVNTGTGKTSTFYDARLQPVLVLTEDTANASTKSFVVSRFDAMGRKVFQSYPVSSLTTVNDTLLGLRNSYDALGRVTRVQQDIEGSAVANTDTAYIAGFRTQVTNPRGNVTTTSYQAFGQPSTDSPVLIQSPEGVTTTITRQPALGKPTQVGRNGYYGGTLLAAVRSYVYDLEERLCEQSEPEPGATVISYDANGNIAWSADGRPSTLYSSAPGTSSATVCANARAAVPASQMISRTYDPMNRELTRTTSSGTENVTTTYYPDGKVNTLTAANPGGNNVTTTYSYNKRRLLTREVLQITPSVAWTFDYAYNTNGHLSSQTYPGNLVVGYAPDGLGRPTQVGTFATGVKYYPNGAISEFTYGNLIVHTMTQNDRKLPARSLDSYVSGGITTKVLDDTYAYDPNGNVLSLADASNAPSADNRTWGVLAPTLYDGLDRLLSVRSTNQWGSLTGNYNAIYTYDPLDNLRSNRLGASVLDYGYDASNRLATLTYNGGPAKTVTTDIAGNITANAYRNQSYTFDIAHRMNAVVGLESYLYDGNGRRARTVNSTTGTIEYFGYGQDGRLLQDWSNRRNVRNGYIYLGNTLVGLYEVTLSTGAVASRYKHTDALGSPVVTTDAGKTVLSRTSYTPFGVPTLPVDGVGYTGHFIDVSTSLTYMQQRYYDPQIGRFLSVDPIPTDPNSGSAFNAYRYASNNPLVFGDPDGRSDLNYVYRGSYILAASLNFDLPGVFTVTGDGSTLGIANGDHNPKVTGEMLAAVARERGQFRGQTIFVAACNFGTALKDGSSQAQRLADASQSPVIAAQGFVMTPSTRKEEGKRSYLSPNPVTLTVAKTIEGKGEGQFAIFLPGGKEPASLGIKSVTYDPNTGKAEITYKASSGASFRKAFVCLSEAGCGQ